MNKKLDIRNVCTSIFLNNSKINDNRPSNSNYNKKYAYNKEEKKDMIVHKETKEINPNINAFRNIIIEDNNKIEENFIINNYIV